MGSGRRRDRCRPAAVSDLQVLLLGFQICLQVFLVDIVDFEEWDNNAILHPPKDLVFKESLIFDRVVDVFDMTICGIQIGHHGFCGFKGADV